MFVKKAGEEFIKTCRKKNANYKFSKNVIKIGYLSELYRYSVNSYYKICWRYHSFDVIEAIL